MKELSKIWLDGEFINWSEAKIHILTHTLHYGGGIFEGIRAYKTKNGPAVFRLDDHLNRFFYSASVLNMKIPFEKEEIKKAILDLIRINKIEECYIRPIAFFGYGKMGLNPEGSPVQVGIIAWPWGQYLGGKETISVKISKYIRLHPQSIVSDAKINGYYVNSILASLDVQSQGYDEALLLDYEGFVAEGPGENIFIVKGRKIFTPVSGSILAGITRKSIIKIAHDLGLSVEEKKISVEELKSADEAFFVGTAVEVCPIGKIDEVLINNQKIGEITKTIKEIFEKVVRAEKEDYLDWLTIVN